MKRVIVSIVILALASCATDEQRGADYKSESLAEVNYTTTNYDFDGGIQSLVNTISALGAGQTDSATTTSITGVVTTAAKHEFEWVMVGLGSTSTAPTSHKYINHAFWIQDQNAGILVFYDEDYDNNGKVDQDYKRAIVSAGDKISIEVTHVMKYNAAGGAIPIVTKFNASTLQLLSSGNDIYYQTKTGAFDANDIGKVFRVEGTTDSTPLYVEYDENLVPMADGTSCEDPPVGTNGPECPKLTYQPKQQTSFISSINNTWKFQLSVSLVRGTLDSYALGEGHQSYNIAAGTNVVLTGPVFSPKYLADGTNNTTAVALVGLMLAITDKPQVSQ